MSLKSKCVLVTGAGGCIGSHLAELLVSQGATVTALSHYNSSNDWGWLECLSCLNDIRAVTGDIRDPHFCLELPREIDCVFHLAALIPIPHSYRARATFVDTNVTGTMNLCQAALRQGVECFVQTSTSEVYGTARYVPIDERYPLSGQSPYSASKIGADAIALSFYYSFSLPVNVARPFNTYGPRQSARAVIPAIISQVASGRDEIDLGDLTPTRDFTFVTDTCRGLSAVADQSGTPGHVFNIGSNQEIAIGELCGLVAELMSRKFRIRDDPTRHRPENSEVLRLRCDAGKLGAASGFAPSVDLREGLARTIGWFQDPKNLGRYKTHLYNV